MMTRRTCLCGPTLGSLAAPLAANAQPPPAKAVRVGVLRGAEDNPAFRKDFEGFRQGLSEGGYVEGPNLTLEYRVALGSADEVLVRGHELARLNLHALLAIGSPALAAAAKATSRIPLVAVDLRTDPDPT